MMMIGKNSWSFSSSSFSLRRRRESFFLFLPPQNDECFHRCRRRRRGHKGDMGQNLDYNYKHIHLRRSCITFMITSHLRVFVRLALPLSKYFRVPRRASGIVHTVVPDCRGSLSLSTSISTYYWETDGKIQQLNKYSSDKLAKEIGRGQLLQQSWEKPVPDQVAASSSFRSPWQWCQ